MNQFGRYIHTYKLLVIALWLLILFGAGFFALELPTVLSGNGFEYAGEFNKTEQILEEEFGQPKSSIILLFEKENKVSDKQWKSFIETSLDRAEEIKTVEDVISPYDRPGLLKDKLAYGMVTFQKESDALGNEIDQLRSKLKNENGVKVSITSEPVIVKDLNEASQEDLAKAEMIGLPIALIVLILAFGGLIAASIPLIVGGISIITTMGIVYFFSYQIDLTIFILNIVPMIGLALSIDFALLFINRYKEELKHHSIAEAINVTVATAGRSIIFSGLCVFIGLSGLLFIDIDIFQNVAVGGMTVVLVSVLSALTFLPAILSLFGPKINSLTILKVKDDQSSVWRKFAKAVMKRPVIMTLSALMILLLFLIPVKDISLAIPGSDALPPNYESRIAYETFEKNFAANEKSKENKVPIIFEMEGSVLEEKNLKEIYNAIEKVNKDKLVSSIESPFQATGTSDASSLYLLLSRDGKQLAPIMDYFVKENKMLVNVYLKTGAASSDRKAWVRTWSEKDLGVKAYFGGFAKFEQEIFDEIYDKTPYGLALILISTFLILMAAFRSLLIPLKAIMMNILSLTATFGIVVWIFQEGHFGVEPVNIGLVLPVFVFSLVFGLSMDYEVFLISRIHETYLHTKDNSKATIEGLASTSKIITSAAAIMIVITGAFAFTGVMPVRQMGVGIAIAIFIDATIVRMVLVPALMKMLGDWNWWFFGLKQKEKTGG